MTVTMDPRLAALAKLGFTAVGQTPPGKLKRTFITTEGPTASGKTDFIRRCPPPQVVIDFDQGMESVAEYDIWGNPILHQVIEMPDLDEAGKTASPGEKALALKSYTHFKALMHDAMAGGAAQTLSVDTGTHAYTLAQIARFGRIAQLGEVPAAMWTAMQGEFEGIFLEYQKYNCNLITSHRQGSKFGGQAGEVEMKGYKAMQSLSQIHLGFEKRAVRDAKFKILGYDLVRVALKSRARYALADPGHPLHEFRVEFIDPVEKVDSFGGDFAAVVAAVYPNTTPADWFPPEIAELIG